MKGDLVILAADKDIEYALRGLFARPSALGIRPLDRTEFLTHPNHDPGLYKNGPEIVRRYAPLFEHALLVLDVAWSGAPQAEVIEKNLDRSLATVWKDRARALCIDPEVEVWIWSDSPNVAAQLGWPQMEALRSWLRESDLWNERSAKPEDPKAAFRAALREQSIPPSSAIFKNLGESVGINRCQDATFARLLRILRTWFPASA